jgi:hypothetical protein
MAITGLVRARRLYRASVTELFVIDGLDQRMPARIGD